MPHDSYSGPSFSEWWFSLDFWLVLKVPCFLFLVYQSLFTLWMSLLQTYGFCLALWAVWGWFGVFLIVMLAWIVLFWFIWIPNIVALGCLTDTHRSFVVLRRTRAALALAGRVLLLSALFWCNGYIVGWIADRNPEASYAAGIIGSKATGDIFDQVAEPRH